MVEGSDSLSVPPASQLSLHQQTRPFFVPYPTFDFCGCNVHYRIVLARLEKLLRGLGRYRSQVIQPEDGQE